MYYSYKSIDSTSILHFNLVMKTQLALSFLLIFWAFFIFYISSSYFVALPTILPSYSSSFRPTS